MTFYLKAIQLKERITMKKWLAIPLAAALLIAPTQTEAKVDISSISATNSHYEGIHYFNQLNVFDYMGNKFYAAANAKRAEVAQVLYMLYRDELKPVRAYKGFSDVPGNHAMYNAIKWSYEVGIFDGSNGQYSPNANIRRDQLAKVLVNAFDLTLNKNNALTFRDVPATDGYYDVVRILASHRITVGDNGYYKPKQNVTNSQLSTFVYRLYKASQGTSASTATATTYDTEYTFDWTVQTAGENLRLRGVDGAKNVASYTAAKGDSIGDIVVGTSTKAHVDKRYTKKVTSILKGNVNYKLPASSEYAVVDVDGQYMYFFYDVHAGNKVRAIYTVNKAYEQAKAGFYGKPTADALRDYDAIMYMLVNQTRQAQGLAALQISSGNEVVAQNHSKDMATNNFFSHTNKKGESPLQRYNRSGTGSFKAVGENIAMGQFNAIFAFESLHNSKGHRDNMLNKTWTHMAIGSAVNSQTQPYYTQLFFR